MSDAAPPACPTFERALELAANWAAGNDAPHPELLAWVRQAMLDSWGGEPVGSALTTGIHMAWKVGRMLGILSLVRPAGAHGVLPLCEAAGWPVHPGPDDEPLPPLR